MALTWRGLMLLGLLLALLVAVIYSRSGLKEGFTGEPDRFSELDAKLRDKVFDNEKLYQFDVAAIKKILGAKGGSAPGVGAKGGSAPGVGAKGLEELEGLDAGCGTGHHLRELEKICPKVVGVDRSSNMIKVARLRNPQGNFQEGNLMDSDLFSEGKFDFIVSPLDSAYYESDNSQLLRNFHKWLRPGGYLFIHLFERKGPLDPSPQPHSQFYDGKDGRHALTYYPGFAHDAHWVPSGSQEGDGLDYVQVYITDNGEKTERRLRLYIPSKRVMIGRLEGLGFKLVDVVSMKPLEIVDFELFAFQKV